MSDLAGDVKKDGASVIEALVPKASALVARIVGFVIKSQGDLAVVNCAYLDARQIEKAVALHFDAREAPFKVDLDKVRRERKAIEIPLHGAVVACKLKMDGYIRDQTRIREEAEREAFLADQKRRIEEVAKKREADALLAKAEQAAADGNLVGSEALLQAAAKSEDAAVELVRTPLPAPRSIPLPVLEGMTKRKNWEVRLDSKLSPEEAEARIPLKYRPIDWPAIKSDANKTEGRIEIPGVEITRDDKLQAKPGRASAGDELPESSTISRG
ncbi:MAG: hypothetical protein IMZ57_11055 [Acidobacteria bacterium]|nr:hypothetical protein [Acidobacteriota bacterium]